MWALLNCTRGIRNVGAEWWDNLSSHEKRLVCTKRSKRGARARAIVGCRGRRRSQYLEEEEEQEEEEATRKLNQLRFSLVVLAESTYEEIVKQTWWLDK